MFLLILLLSLLLLLLLLFYQHPCHFFVIKGMTLVVEKGELVVARIIHGGMIDRQGKQIKEISIYQVGLGDLLHS